MPLVAFLSSVTGLLALEQLVVHRKTWETADESKINLKKGGRAAQGPPPHLCVHKQKRLGQT